MATNTSGNLESDDRPCHDGPGPRPASSLDDSPPVRGSGPSDSKPALEPPAEPTLPPLTPEEFRIYNRLAETMDYFHDHFRQMYTTLHTACTTNRRPANMTLRQFLDEGLRLARYLEMHHAIEEAHLYPLLGRKMPEFRSAAAPAPSFSSSSSCSSSSRHGGESSADEDEDEDDIGEQQNTNPNGNGTGTGTGTGGARGRRGVRRRKGGRKGGKRGEETCELLRQHRIIHDGVEGMAAYLRRCKERECELELGVLRDKIEPWGDVLLRHLDQEVRDLGADKMRRYWTVAEMKAFPI